MIAVTIPSCTRLEKTIPRRLIRKGGRITAHATRWISRRPSGNAYPRYEAAISVTAGAPAMNQSANSHPVAAAASRPNASLAKA